MFAKRICWPLVVFAATLLTTDLVWALGFELGETKEQLKLKYDISVTDHGTGRVTVVLTLADPGRLGPLDSMDLMVPGAERQKDGGTLVDLSVSLAPTADGDKQVVRAHLTRELAQRAQIQLKTHRLDGKQQPLTWYYHPIRIAEYLKLE